MSLVKIEERPNKIWVCEMQRADKLNALSKQLIAELKRSFDSVAVAARAFECRALILRSSNAKAFCVGADLAERKAMSDEEVVDALDSLRSLMESLEAIPCPTVAVVEGGAFGGGLELALCCDLRVSSEDAVMALSETRLAIVPGAGGTQRLTDLVGKARAKEWIFSGKKISASEAERYGLVNAVSSNPRSWADDYLAQVVEGGPIAILAAKEAINYADKNLPEALDAERRAYLKTLKTKDRFEGLLAFSEKRKPDYKGH